MRVLPYVMAGLLIGAAVAGSPAVAADAAALKTVMPGDKAIGDPAAPVTLIEYASLSCSHCAAFHNRVLPVIRKDYIDTGKLRYVFRDFPLNGTALFASLVAHCSGKQGGDEKYQKILHEIMSQQSAWTQSDSARVSLLLLATREGVDGKQLTACIDDDKALEEQIIASRKEASEQLGVKKTPAFLVNGELVESMATPEEARKVIDAALAKTNPQPAAPAALRGAKP